MKKYVLGAVKYGVSLALLGYLFYQAASDDSFRQLRDEPKNWAMLIAAAVVTLVAISMTNVRWYWLVRAQDLRFSMRDAFRLGFLGMLFSFFSLGVVGGDFIKSVFIARQQPGGRTRAVASVVVDRLIGLYALLIVGSCAYLLFGVRGVAGIDADAAAAVEFTCQMGVGLTVLGAVGIWLLSLRSVADGPLVRRVARLPKVGAVVEQLAGALQAYRSRPWVMACALLISMANHALFATAVYLIARGLPGHCPTLSQHFVIVPLASMGAILPLPGGLGAFEYALDLLYRSVSPAGVAERQGFIVSLAFLVIKILIAMIGMVYYLAGRREVKQLIDAAEKTNGNERPVLESSPSMRDPKMA